MAAKTLLKSLQHKRHEIRKHRSKSFFSLIYTLNIICQFFGVAPILDTPRQNRHTLRHLHYIWCCMLVIYIYVVNSYYATRVHTQLVTILKVFFISELINGPLIVFLIAITIYYYSEQYRRIPRDLLRIYKSYKSFQPTFWSGKDLFRVLHKEVRLMLGVVCSIVLCCFVVEYMRTEHGFVHNVLNSSVFNLPNILISLNLGQYWLSLRFVYQLYRGFNEILKQRLRAFRSNNFTAHEEQFTNGAYTSELAWYQREFYSSCPGGVGDYKILKSIRGPYFDLDTIMAQLTNVFGIILLFNFLGSLLSLSVECFAVYKYFDAPEFLDDELAEVYHRWFIILIHAGRLLLILVANNAIIEEKCRTSFVINELSIISKEMEHEVNRFLLRLMVNQSAQMAYGVIDLDLLVLSSIAGVMANYIIFLIQIDLGSTTMEERIRNMTAMRANSSNSL